MNGGYRVYTDPSAIQSAEMVQQAVNTGWPWYAGLVIGFVVFLIVVWVLKLFLGPIYNVWAEKKAGEADYARARNEQNIQIAQAESRLKAAEKNKEASIIEARAVSESIRIIGETVTSNELYLRWQWLEALRQRQGDTIYVPTEANMPIMEAGRTVNR